MSTRPANADGPLARPVNPRTGAMTKGRQADSARRRQRVIAALDKAVCDGTEISVARIARSAQDNLGVLTWRWSTATCWRSRRISASLAWSERASRASQPKTRRATR